MYEAAADAGKGKANDGTRPSLLREVPLDDARAAPIHRGMMEGFIGELLRTDYLAKQLIRDGWRGKAFSAPARARAAEPTVLVLSGTRMARPDEAAWGLVSATAGLLRPGQAAPQCDVDRNRRRSAVRSRIRADGVGPRLAA